MRCCSPSDLRATRKREGIEAVAMRVVLRTPIGQMRT